MTSTVVLGLLLITTAAVGPQIVDRPSSIVDRRSSSIVDRPSSIVYRQSIDDRRSTMDDRRPELPRAKVDTSEAPTTGRTIHVAAGESLQSALDEAQPGDRITLEAGAT